MTDPVQLDKPPEGVAVACRKCGRTLATLQGAFLHLSPAVALSVRSRHDLRCLSCGYWRAWKPSEIVDTPPGKP